ncbi:MAG: MFS transporter [Ilumatobacter sp.]|nr:MFS transporter [Ilumatobacter sp.]
MTRHAEPTAEELDGIDPHVFHRRWAILATMCLSLVLIVATVSSVNVAIPSLSKSALRPTDTQVLWIIDAYALVFAALLLPAGAIGDRFGRKGALLTGLVIFASASAASAFMGHATALIACRAIMGIGAALIMPSTLSLLQSAFPRRERAKAIAVWAGFAGAGAAIGPLIGGILLAHFWYGSVFFVSVPIAAVAFVASWILAPSSREASAHPLDLASARCCPSSGSPRCSRPSSKAPSAVGAAPSWSAGSCWPRRRSPASCSTSGAPQSRCWN